MHSKRLIIHDLALLALAGTFVGCSATEPDPGPAWVKSLSISSPPILMTGPGVARARVELATADTQLTVHADTTTVAISATGPFTATWEIARTPWRVLNISASAPGTGSITIAAGGKSASISITAVALGFKSVDMTAGYACGISLDDTAWCWGGNDVGELGLVTVGQCNGSACQYGGNAGNATPLPVNGGRTYTQVATGGNQCFLTGFTGVCGTTCGLTAVGQLWCWGKGFPSPSALVATPVSFKSLSIQPDRFTLPGNGNQQACGLASDGTAYCLAATTLTPIGNGMTFTALSVGSTHSCGVDTVGDVYCWGDNTEGSLGIGIADSSSHPNPQRAIASAKFTSVDVGRHSSCALDTSGVVSCWGQGYAVDGITPPPACAGTSLCQTTPRAVAGGGTYVAFSRSDNDNRMCALTSAGKVDCWMTYNKAPSTITVPEPLINLSVGSDMPLVACGVSASHVAYCWNTAGVVAKLGQ